MFVFVRTCVKAGWPPGTRALMIRPMCTIGIGSATGFLAPPPPDGGVRADTHPPRVGRTTPPPARGGGELNPGWEKTQV